MPDHEDDFYRHREAITHRIGELDKKTDRAFEQVVKVDEASIKRDQGLDGRLSKVEWRIAFALGVVGAAGFFGAVLVWMANYLSVAMKLFPPH